MIRDLFFQKQNGAQVKTTEIYLKYISARLHPVLLPEKEHHVFLENVFDSSIFNPSIIDAHDKQLTCIARIDERLHLRKWHPDYSPKTPNVRNAWFVLDRELKTVSVTEVDDNLLRDSCPQAACGIEDVRLFKHLGELWGIGSGIRLNNRGRRKSSAVIVRFDGPKIIECFALKLPIETDVERNWTPVVIEDQLRLIYSFKPLVVLSFEAAKPVETIGKALPNLPHVIRGGTGFIPWGDDLLAIVHYPPVLHPELGIALKYYLHSFLLMDRNFTIKHISDPFYIHRRGIEFAMGLIDAGDHLLLSYGIGDTKAAIAKLDKSLVEYYL